MSMVSEKKERTSLNEADAKALLKLYGIPVVHEAVAKTIEEAIPAAAEIGYPLVLKGLGSQLMHKTELGIVYINLLNEKALIQAAEEIREKTGDKLEGFLIQPFITGKRELVAGLIKDPQFGPMVMVGLGGVYTEALHDISFRMAPLSEYDALDMIRELRSSKLFESYRGEAPADKAQIISVLTGLSRLALEMPEVEEIDINPIIISAKGELCAVDALIVKNNAKKYGAVSVVVPHDLTTMMSPKSIAFIGASTQFGKWGQMLPTVTITNGFAGDIYLVNPRGGSFYGREIHTSLDEIEGEIDLAVITIPAEKIVEIIPSLIRKGIKNAAVISSGYSEIGEGGKKLELELIDAMKKAGITFIGPNLMGLGNPYESLNISIYGRRNVPGPLGLISQSGNMGLLFSMVAIMNHIGIACVCTNGNEAMVGTEDFIEYCSQNDKVKVIAGYIERINDGRRFYSTAKKATEKKPVLMLKGGQSSMGSVAAASHTGGMRTDSKIFNAICDQAGVIRVESVQEMLDTGAAFSYLPLPKGKRIAIMTMGGGMGVILTDLCEKYGLEVPALSIELIEEFNEHFPPFWSHANPVDMLNGADKTIPLKVMESLAKWDGCDVIIHNALVGNQNDMIDSLMECLTQMDSNLPDQLVGQIEKSKQIMGDDLHKKVLELMVKYDKPIIGVGGNLVDEKGKLVFMKDENTELGSLAFLTPERVVSSISYMHKHAETKKRRDFQK